jgi:hypothetical protein
MPALIVIGAAGSTRRRDRSMIASRPQASLLRRGREQDRELVSAEPEGLAAQPEVRRQCASTSAAGGGRCGPEVVDVHEAKERQFWALECDLALQPVVEVAVVCFRSAGR